MVPATMQFTIPYFYLDLILFRSWWRNPCLHIWSWVMQLDLLSLSPGIARHFGAHPCTKGKVTTDESCVDGSQYRMWVDCGRRQNYNAWILTYSRFELGSDQRYLSDKIMSLHLFAKNEMFWKDGNGHDRTFRYKQGKQKKNYLLSPLVQNPN
jgi:hypothetical protein